MQEDNRHTYHTCGVVWQSLVKFYRRCGNSRVVTSIKSNFISPRQAKMDKLPIDEVAVKFVLYSSMSLPVRSLPTYCPPFLRALYCTVSCHCCSSLMSVFFFRSHNRLLYANRATWQHFRSLRSRYYAQTHANGGVYCKDTRVMRNTSVTIATDAQIRKQFPNVFHVDDFEEVYARYVARSETLFGKDMGKALNETLHAKSGKKKAKKFEQLRVVKRKKVSNRKLVSDS